MIFLALNVPALIIFEYNLSIKYAIFNVDHASYFFSLVSVCFYHKINSFRRISAKKSILYFSPECLINNGTHISSVHPGNTVDSYITIEPFFKYFETSMLLFLRGFKSGFLFFKIGVGTVIINMLHFFKSFGLKL